MKSILSMVIGASLACCAIEAGAEEPITLQKIQLDIGRQSLTDALNAWAEQTGFQLVCLAPEVARELVAPKVKGAFTAMGALEQLLSGTPLVYEFTSERMVTVRARFTAASQTTGHLDRVDVPRLQIAALGAAEESSGPTRQSETGATRGAASRDNSTKDVDVEELEEIVVTGTYIRGATPAGAKIHVLTKDDIGRSGYATIQDIVKVLPQNFGGGVSQDNNADSTAFNLNGGTAINLRGLGADSTLILVNGRRQPSGGLNGSFVDISSIATSAIDRVEILPDGASALYGSDAVGGVVNFVLRKDYEGAETTARFGTLDGDADEMQVSQLVGRTWATGSALGSYQYYRRSELERTDRARTRSDDLTRFGGTDYRDPNANPGNILDPLTFQPAYAIPRGQTGLALTAADLLPGVVNLRDSGVEADLLPKQDMHSIFASLDQQLREGLELSVEGRFSTRFNKLRNPAAFTTLSVPDSNPFFVDPFGGQTAISVAYDFFADLGPVIGESRTETSVATLGLGVDLGSAWRMSIAGVHGRENTRYTSKNLVDFSALAEALVNSDPITAFNPFADGSNTNASTLAAIRSTQFNRSRTHFSSATLLGEGPIFSIGGNQAKLAIGAEHRTEKLTSSTRVPDVFLAESDVHRDISAAFMELALPVFAPRNGVYGIDRLDVSLAGRYEDYSDQREATFNPKIGVTWSPVHSVDIRATWGTSFKAPRLIDLQDAPDANSAIGNILFVTDLPDPLSASGFSPVLMRFGNNPNLEPEKATTITMGFSAKPDALKDFSFGANYFQIKSRNRIAVGGPAGDPFAILLAENEWSPLIDRSPDPAEVETLCNSPQFLFGDCSVLPAALVDLRLRNLSQLRVRGVDVDAQKEFRTGVGIFSAKLNGTYVLDFKRKVTATAQEVDVVDTFGNLPALRLRGTVSWQAAHVTIEASGNFVGRYQDTLHSSTPRIGSYSTVDLSTAYDTPGTDPWFGNLRVTLTAVNVFDEEPPFADAQFFGYDSANADILGRLISLQVLKRW